MEPQTRIFNSLQRSQIVAFEISGEWTGRMETRAQIFSSKFPVLPTLIIKLVLVARKPGYLINI